MEKLVTQITLVPEGQPTHDPLAFTIDVSDEGGGEFVEVRNVDTGHGLRVDPKDWPHVREAMDDMIGRCRG